MLSISIILVLVQSLYLFESISGHGFLADPPSRSSAWLFDADFKECCRYYNHAEMSCGGASRQWVANGGKCSICGEPFDSQPKLLGVGDKKYLGKIVRTYVQGTFIPVTVVITANHMGRFEFRICNIDKDSSKDATQECLDLNMLKTDKGTTEYKIEKSYATVHVNVTLPPTLLCKHCVFQWKYVTGNSWGTFNGRSCLGCGRENEEFYGCSDIAIISPVEALVNVQSTPPAIIPPPPTTLKPNQPPCKCTSAVTFSSAFDIGDIMEQYCHIVCLNDCAVDKLSGNEVLYKSCLNSCSKLCVCG